jgi:uncharacterized protein (DUF2062 family)
MGRVRTWVAGLLALNGTPQGVAGGFALGVGLSLIPTRSRACCWPWPWRRR